MAFFSTTVNRLGHAMTKHIINEISVTSPSIFQIRCKSNMTKLFVTGLAQRTDDISLQKAFSVCGKVSKAEVVKHEETCRSRGIGFVTYKDPESATAAIIKMNQMKLHGRALSVIYAKNRPKYKKWLTLFVGGLSHATNNTNLREAFSVFGKVSEAKVIMHRASGKSRGFGFVTFEDEREAHDALDAMDQWELHGKTVNVYFANCCYGGKCDSLNSDSDSEGDGEGEGDVKSDGDAVESDGDAENDGDVESDKDNASENEDDSVGCNGNINNSETHRGSKSDNDNENDNENDNDDDDDDDGDGDGGGAGSRGDVITINISNISITIPRAMMSP